MNKRNIKIINKRKQLKIIIPIIIIYIAASAFTIAIISISFKKSINEIDYAISDLNSSIKTEDDIVNSFVFVAKKLIGKEYELHTEKITTDHNKSLTKINDQIEVLRQISIRQMNILYILIGVLSVIAIILTLFLTGITHKIYGPVYVMTKYLKDILKGKEISGRALRKGDELYDLNNLIVKVGVKLNKQKNIKKTK